MSNDKLQCHNLSDPASHDAKQRVLSLISQSRHYPTAIAVYCRLRSRHISDHSYLITASPEVSDGEPWLVAFVDRTRRPETQLWLHSSWDVSEESSRANDITQLLSELFRLIKSLPLPESIHATSHSAGGGDITTAKDAQVNNDIVLCGAIHENTVHFMREAGLIVNQPGTPETGYHTYIFDIDNLPEDIPLVDGLYWSRPTTNHYALIKSTSTIPRQDRTLAILRSRAIIAKDDDTPVAWGFVGIDGSVSTLYVMPDHRGLGLGKALMLRLLKEDMDGLSDTDTSKLGYCHVAPDNHESIRMVEGIGGTKDGRAVYWVRVDVAKA